MRIEIEARAFDPPEGVLVVDGAPPAAFRSWLELLGLLSRVLDPAALQPAGGDLR